MSHHVTFFHAYLLCTTPAPFPSMIVVIIYISPPKQRSVSNFRVTIKEEQEIESCPEEWVEIVSNSFPSERDKNRTQ